MSGSDRRASRSSPSWRVSERASPSRLVEHEDPPDVAVERVLGGEPDARPAPAGSGGRPCGRRGRRAPWPSPRSAGTGRARRRRARRRRSRSRPGSRPAGGGRPGTWRSAGRTGPARAACVPCQLEHRPRGARRARGRAARWPAATAAAHVDRGRRRTPAPRSPVTSTRPSAGIDAGDRAQRRASPVATTAAALPATATTTTGPGAASADGAEARRRRGAVRRPCRAVPSAPSGGQHDAHGSDPSPRAPSHDPVERGRRRRWPRPGARTAATRRRAGRRPARPRQPELASSAASSAAPVWRLGGVRGGSVGEAAPASSASISGRSPGRAGGGR